MFFVFLMRVVINMAEANDVKMKADDGTYDQACASTSNVLPVSSVIRNTAFDDRSDDGDPKQCMDQKYEALFEYCGHVNPDADTSDGTLGGSSSEDEGLDDTYKQKSMNFKSYDGLPLPNTRRQWQQDDIAIGAGTKVDAASRDISKKPARKTKELLYPISRDVAYKHGGLPARLQGQNLRVRGRPYARASRDQVTQWDQHPWSIAQYLIAGLPICNVDDNTSKDCGYCAVMEPAERTKRASTAKNKRVQFNKEPRILITNPVRA